MELCCRRRGFEPHEVCGAKSVYRCQDTLRRKDTRVIKSDYSTQNIEILSYSFVYSIYITCTLRPNTNLTTDGSDLFFNKKERDPDQLKN